ncbi:MAG: UbiA family prenyltransferase [Anaerolineae bacterium]|nr:UbiA family prenyltransferase [Anaerolineae bacterium]
MWRKAKDFLELIKFEHTIFALPFAYLGMMLAAHTDQGRWPTWAEFFGITVAMAAARTCAMGVNRLVDRHIDAQNPRTSQRPLVSGRISVATATWGTGIAAAILILAAWQLGDLPLQLLPGAALFLLGYSYSKRFTWMSHYILGFTDGLAPMGAWVAVRGSLFTAGDWPGWVLLAGVTLWIGGFDIIYACQDAEFDREARLHAIPARFGIAAALRISGISHVAMVGLLALLGAGLNLAWPFWLGLGIACLLLIYEHSLINPRDLSRLNLAFFNVNGYISILLFLSVLGALLLE